MDRERGSAGLRLPRKAIRDERLLIAHHMLELLVRETALMPVPQQQALRVAVLAIEGVREWCRRHAEESDGLRPRGE
jgi:hypothetical protein